MNKEIFKITFNQIPYFTIEAVKQLYDAENLSEGSIQTLYIAG